MKINKKVLISFMIIFMLINCVFLTNVFAKISNPFDTLKKSDGEISTKAATALKVFLTFIQVGVIGIFAIRLTIVSIRYFSAVAAVEKAATGKELGNTLFMAAIAISATGIITLLWDNLYSA